jgi:hypothetical protein
MGMIQQIAILLMFRGKDEGLACCQMDAGSSGAEACLLYDKAAKAVANENQRLTLPVSLINAPSMESREKFHGDISETLCGRIFLQVRRIIESINLSGGQNIWQQVF